MNTEKEIKLEDLQSFGNAPEVKQEVIKKDEVKKNEVSTDVMPKNMSDLVNNTMQNYMERGLILPKDYNVQNAVIASYLIIKQDPKLNTCTKDSIASSLIDMATMGLSASKKQCYFIPYSGQLQLSPSYFGKVVAIKRIKGVIDVVADVIYKGTEYELSNDEYGNDEITIKKPCPLEERKLENIVGAWCKILLDESIWGKKAYTCIMTMEQIEKSWNQGAAKGKSPAHTNFKDEMSKKSVINRCCKLFVNSAKDQDILIETINRTIDNEYENDSKIITNKSKTVDFE